MRADNPLGLDVFCSGNVTLADGRVLLVGGHDAPRRSAFRRRRSSTRATGTWSTGPKMQYARWYPTATECPTAASWCSAGTSRRGPGPTRRRSSTPPPTSSAADRRQHFASPRGGVPLAFLLPDGKVFTIISSTGNARLLASARDVDRSDRCRSPTAPRSCTGPARSCSPAEANLHGRERRAHQTRPSIDMTAAAPPWRTVAPMDQPRYMPHPDHAGRRQGLGRRRFDHDRRAHTTGTLVDRDLGSATPAWTKSRRWPVPRLYHSTAVLHARRPRPDRRRRPRRGSAVAVAVQRAVLLAAVSLQGRPADDHVGPEHRPVRLVDRRDTPDAASISSVSLVNLGADTHTLDMNQHFVPLSFTKRSGALTVDVPPSPALVPPGTYMLFIVNDKGVPSIAPFIKVAASTTPPSVTITAPTGGSVSGSVPRQPPRRTGAGSRRCSSRSTARRSVRS